MIGARVLTVGAAHLAGSEDAAGLAMARALLAEGLPVLGRAVVDEDEGALEASLRAALETAGLVVVLAASGGSSGEIVRRVVARLAEARLVLSERMLSALEEDFSRRGQAMPRRLDRLALLPQGAQVWPGPAGEPGWALAVRQTPVCDDQRKCGGRDVCARLVNGGGNREAECVSPRVKGAMHQFSMRRLVFN